MKRFHVHLHVGDLAKSVGLYSKLFATEPARLEGDYAKWMLEDNIPVFNKAAAQASAGSACCAPELAVAASTEPAACCASTPRGKPIGIPIKSSTSCC